MFHIPHLTYSISNDGSLLTVYESARGRLDVIKEYTFPIYILPLT